MQVLVRNQHLCTECGAPLISHNGALVCRECGLEHRRELVPGTFKIGESIDYGEDYSASRSTSVNDADVLVDGDGLGTYISSSVRMSSSYQRAKIYRLQQLNRRIALKHLEQERKVLVWLGRYASELGLSGQIVRRAKHLCKQAMRRLQQVGDEFNNCSLNRVILGCSSTIFAAREARVPMDPQEIIDVWAQRHRVTLCNVRKGLYWIQKQTGIPFSFSRPIDYVDKTVSELRACNELMERISDRGLDLERLMQRLRQDLSMILSATPSVVYQGRKPSTLTPALAYVLLKRQCVGVSQKVVARACGISYLTMRYGSSLWREYLR